MSAFKDAVGEDVKAVFLSEDAFGETHVINGVETLCIVDVSLTREAEDSAAYPTEGVFLRLKTIYLATNDIDPIPVEGAVMMLDGELTTVRTVSDEMGILCIVVEASAQ